MTKPVNGFDKRPQDINRNGAPRKEWTWSGLLRSLAEETGKSGLELKAEIANALLTKAASGDVQAIKEFGDRVDGKARQGIELMGENGNPIETSLTVKFVSADE